MKLNGEAATVEVEDSEAIPDPEPRDASRGAFIELNYDAGAEGHAAPHRGQGLYFPGDSYVAVRCRKAGKVARLRRQRAEVAGRFRTGAFSQPGPQRIYLQARTRHYVPPKVSTRTLM